VTLAEGAGYLALGMAYGVTVALIAVTLFMLFCLAIAPRQAPAGRHRATSGGRLWTVDGPRVRGHRRSS